MTVVVLRHDLHGSVRLADVSVTLDGMLVYSTHGAEDTPHEIEILRGKIPPGPHQIFVSGVVAEKCGIATSEHTVMIARGQQSIVTGTQPAKITIAFLTKDPYGPPQDRVALNVGVHDAKNEGLIRRTELARDECGPRVDRVPDTSDPNPRIIIP